MSGSWSATSLNDIPSLPTEEEREEEVALLRDWWPDFVQVYQRAAANGWAVICEEP